MTSTTIGEVAQRTGFSTSALRYYERVGLLRPAGRSTGGYRVYDAASVSRLRFIARAKQLGCSLEEIQDLLAIRDGERCGPVQRRLHRLVTDKIALATGRITELEGLVVQLRGAASELNGEPVDGPCDDGCACASASSSSGPADALPPVGCGLAATELPGRLAEWEVALGRIRGRSPLDDGGLRLDLDPGTDLARLAGLIAAEQRCCPFLHFALTVDQRGAGLEIRAPGADPGTVPALFGEPSPP